jgi:hypothetical protein
VLRVGVLVPTSMLPLPTTDILCWRFATTRNCLERLHAVWIESVAPILRFTAAGFADGSSPAEKG